MTNDAKHRYNRKNTADNKNLYNGNFVRKPSRPKSVNESLNVSWIFSLVKYSRVARCPQLKQ